MTKRKVPAVIKFTPNPIQPPTENISRGEILAVSRTRRSGETCFIVFQQGKIQTRSIRSKVDGTIEQLDGFPTNFVDEPKVGTLMIGDTIDLWINSEDYKIVELAANSKGCVKKDGVWHYKWSLGMIAYPKKSNSLVMRKWAVTSNTEGKAEIIGLPFYMNSDVSIREIDMYLVYLNQYINGNEEDPPPIKIREFLKMFRESDLADTPDDYPTESVEEEEEVEVVDPSENPEAVNEAISALFEEPKVASSKSKSRKSRPKAKAKTTESASSATGEETATKKKGRSKKTVTK